MLSGMYMNLSMAEKHLLSVGIAPERYVRSVEAGDCAYW